ncbi:MAG: PadR family transcriptional regulator [Acidobacteria bacterium]|nr:PadR family transcriptional regulator [Acidobacteriota bacterium]
MQDLPLTPRVMLILWALDTGPKHGYRLLSEVETLGRGRVTIGPASLYESIQSLRSKGWIEPAEIPAEATSHDRRRRYFQLTGDGQGVLRAEALRLAELVDDLRANGIVDEAGAQ